MNRILYQYESTTIRRFREETAFAFFHSIQLCAGRDVRIDHEQVQSFFAVLLLDRAQQHAAGFDAHHRTQRRVGDRHASLTNQLFRLISTYVALYQFPFSFHFCEKPSHVTVYHVTFLFHRKVLVNHVILTSELFSFRLAVGFITGKKYGKKCHNSFTRFISTLT